MSIRLKITLWFSLIVVILVGITLLIALNASRVVLRGTVRDYMLSTVEENVDKIKLVQEIKDGTEKIYIPFDTEQLEIDIDFMRLDNDVYTALYLSDGTMLYGENPLSKKTREILFTGTRVWNVNIDGVRYDLYDRKLNLSPENGAELWIRGIVSETKSAQQLQGILHLVLSLIPVLILISILSGYFLAGKLLSPVQNIERTAARIAKGDDLQQRIAAGKSNDEIGKLIGVFNAMLDRLERAFENERRFTSDASHELRTPTSVILAQSEYVLEKPRSSEEYAEAFEVVLSQAQRMSALIGDMLDYTRMEQGSERYDFTPVNLSALVSELAGQVTTPQEKRITITHNVESDIMVSGNEMLLCRLVQNLIDNAYRYGKEDGRILVSLVSKNQCVILSVEDNGIGIAEDELEKIFERFYRSDASRTVKGTGLGLSMVKRIAELHNASVQVDSKLGEGSIFKIIFEKNSGSNSVLIKPC